MKKLRASRFLLVLLVAFLPIIFYGCPNPTDILTERVSNPTDNIQSVIAESFAPNETWTFMIYLDGDNNLEDAAIDDFNEMVAGLNNLNNPNIKVIVLLDRISGYNSTEFLGEVEDWHGARVYEINQTNSYTKKTDAWFVDGDERNMGDPITLNSFIEYCKTNYTSNHYALVLWNHGGGARSKDVTLSTSSSLTKAVCWDDTDDEDCLYLDEVQQALVSMFNSSNKLDFIGFDACLMGTVEVAYEFRDLALVMAASMASEQGDGWDYNALFSNMQSGINNDPKELGKLVVKTYSEFISSYYYNQTQSAIDLLQISNLKTKIDQLAVSIYQENKKTSFEKTRDLSYHFYSTDDDSISLPYFDLNDLCYQIINNNLIYSSNIIAKCQEVINSLSNAIIAAYAGEYYGNYYGLGSTIKRGLSIFVSRGDIIYNSYSHYAYQWWYTDVDTDQWWPGEHYYGLIDFAQSDDDGDVEYWRELFEYWYDNGTTYTPSSY